MMIKTVFQDISTLNPPGINSNYSYTCRPHYLLSVCLWTLPVSHFTLHRMGKLFIFIPGKENACVSTAYIYPPILFKNKDFSS